MVSAANLERERLLKIAQEYREKGYQVLFQPQLEELPDFLRGYQPDMVAQRGEEKVVVEVKSRFSLNASSAQSLRYLAQEIEKHPGWRFELVMTNPNDSIHSTQIEGSLQEQEIASRVEVAKELADKHPESAILYAWALAEATLRLLAQREGLSLQGFDPAYLLKQLVTEGVISKTEYDLLRNTSSLRNAIAHGFKAAQLTPNSVHELLGVTDQLLRSLHTRPPA
ncbi:hypothetical protein [Gloeocapsopsis sp. IPPAS B-1203]|uniref:hypothetical protein n=1 Tax=Gloeocapsopsis sp. IPPAS B-1203 TaxID=2049454 RepID=UPI000C1948C7|nr:hypothetical protein [Gloeocapsopsis sp. IPPAS B-1203]PIG93866.1 hypothetical protein CSQ79_09645 [Gloeocapsopsis sp. IPPAS B-1203]